MKALSPLVVFLISLLLLQGCVAAAVVGAATISTKAAIDPRTIGTQIDDSTLALRVNRALFKDKQIKKETRINVITYQGKVLLTGQVPNIALASLAKQIVMNIDGVSEVFNQVRHAHPIGISTILSDLWITTKVCSQMLSSNKVKSSNVKVTTENGEVFLLGLVTEYEAKVAMDIASRIFGVKHVITAFTYVK